MLGSTSAHSSPAARRAQLRFRPVSGGLSARFPPRTARLDAAGGLPEYGPADAGGLERDLEPLLEDFVEMADKRRPTRPRQVSEESRERLRALGYLE